MDGLYVNDANEVSFYDPWGKPYYITICEEDEGAIDPFSSRRYRGKNCLVYSTGPDTEGVASTDAPKRKPQGGKKPAASTAAAELAEEALEDNVYSWKNQK